MKKEGNSDSKNMIIILFKRIIRNGWQIFLREKEITFSTVFILFITLIFANFLFYLKSFSHHLISVSQERADVSVYFKEETPEEEIIKLEEELKKIPEIKEIKYFSRQEALESFKEKHKENKILMETLEEVGVNPFLASLKIRTGEMVNYESIVNNLTTSPFKEIIDKIDYSERKEIIEKIFKVSKNLEKGILFFSLIFGIISVLILFNTIRLAIFNRQDEIKIQRLVGASSWFIRGPFIVQGIISAFFAVILSLLILTLLSWFLAPKVEIFVPGFNLWQFLLTNFWFILSFHLLTGMGLVIFSSFLAIKKYLKV